MRSGIAVVSKVHPFDGDRGPVHNDTLFGVVMQHPIAALHCSTGGRMYARPNGTRNLEALESWSKKRGAYGDPGFVRALAEGS